MASPPGQDDLLMEMAESEAPPRGSGGGRQASFDEDPDHWGEAGGPPDPVPADRAGCASCSVGARTDLGAPGPINTPLSTDLDAIPRLQSSVSQQPGSAAGSCASLSQSEPGVSKEFSRDSLGSSASQGGVGAPAHGGRLVGPAVRVRRDRCSEAWV